MHRVLTTATVLLTALFALSNIAAIPALWGLNLFSFLPAPLLFVVLAVAGLLLIPSVSRAAQNMLAGFDGRLPRRTPGKIVAGGLIAAAFVAVCISCRAALPLLGDGSLRINQILDGTWLYPTELLDFLVHAALFHFALKPLGNTVAAAYWFIGAISGLFFFFGLRRLARYLYPSQHVAAFLLLASSGLIVIFVGYVESYAITAALFPWLILTALTTLEQHTSPLRFVLLYILATLVHLVAGILFFPVLVLVLTSTRRREDTAPVNLALWPALLTIAAFAIGLIGAALGIGLLDRNLLPIIAGPSHPHGIASPGHLVNVANWLLLSALPALALLPVLVISASRKRLVPSLPTLLALSLSLSSILFILLFNPQLGGARDWDLFSLPAFLLIPAALIAARQWLPDLSLHRLLPVSAIALGLVVAFVAINTSTLRSVARYEEVIHQHATRSLYHEYSLLYTSLYRYPDQLPELQPRRIEFGIKTWQSPPRNRGDSLQLGKLLAQDFLALGDQSRTREFVATLIRLDSTDVENYLLLGRYLDRFGTVPQRAQLAVSIRDRFATSARGQMEAGIMFLNVGDTLAGGECLTDAYRMNPSDSLVAVNYAIYLLSVGDYIRAEQVYEQVVRLSPSSFEAQYGLAVASVSAKHPQKAVTHLNRARGLARSPDQVSRVSRLLSVLTGR